MTTIHSYTNDQQILDLPHKDLRRARAAALSMIPTTTGAAKALKEVLPAMAGKLDGMAIRVPTPNVSLVDLTVAPREAGDAKDGQRGVPQGRRRARSRASSRSATSRSCRATTTATSHSSTVDARAHDRRSAIMVKVMSWYDNEMGYSQRLFDLAKYVGERL